MVNEKMLQTIEEIDQFIKENIELRGWFDPTCLWGIKNPYDVFNRLHQLGLKVEVYKEKTTNRPSIAGHIQVYDYMKEHCISVCKYLGNYIQELYITHWTGRTVYFGSVGEEPVCYIPAKSRLFKCFKGNYIVKSQLSSGEYEYYMLTPEELEEKYEQF